MKIKRDLKEELKMRNPNKDLEIIINGKSHFIKKEDFWNTYISIPITITKKTLI